MLTSSPSALQSALGIVSHYAKRYQLRFNVDKTKIVVTGSKADMNYYKETHLWNLNGETVSVVDDNDHLASWACRVWNESAWPKEKLACLVRVTAFPDKKLRLEALTNSKITFLNVILDFQAGLTKQSKASTQLKMQENSDYI